MEEIINYVKPELMVVSVVLYFIGVWLKQSQIIKNKFIPLTLGLLGILICAIYVFATCHCETPQEIAMAVFIAATQGVLVAGLSTYVNQLIKQNRKNE